MIVTVTLNPAFDKPLTVPSLQPGALHRVTVGPVVPSGKGINVARVLTRWGIDVTALVLAGNGQERFSAFLTAEQVKHQIISVPGDIRTNIKLYEEDFRRMTELNEPGPMVEGAKLAELESALFRLARAARVVVFSGSLPPGAPPNWYARLVSGVVNAGALPVVDTSGSALRHAVTQPLYALKPNLAEARELLELNGTNHQAVDEIRQRLQNFGVNHLILTMGEEGALFAAEGKVVRTIPPAIKAGNAAGAGDSLLATYLAGLELGWPLSVRAARATAAGAAAARGLGTDLGSPDEVYTLESQVVLHNES